MNINQAKAVAGIRHKIASRVELERAVLHCKNEIIAARRANNDVRAAALSEAKSFFQRRARARNTCLVCHIPIARGATHCQIHSRVQKMIPGPIELKPVAKRIGKERIALYEDQLATLGYYSKTVQKVLEKWRNTINEETLRDYFSHVATSVVHDRKSVELPELMPQSHWLPIFELGAAVAKIINDRSRPQSWLILGGCMTCATNGKFDDWETIRTSIIKSGGPAFSKSALAKASHDLELKVSKETVKFWREFSNYQKR